MAFYMKYSPGSRSIINALFSNKLISRQLRVPTIHPQYNTPTIQPRGVDLSNFKIVEISSIAENCFYLCYCTRDEKRTLEMFCTENKVSYLKPGHEKKFCP